MEMGSHLILLEMYWVSAVTKKKLRYMIHCIRSPDAKVCRIIKNVFQTPSNASFMFKMQKQEKNHDCGISAIAIATLLA